MADFDSVHGAGLNRAMPNITRIELGKERFKFSSGHFTIFSAHERENLHGHNFTVSADMSVIVHADGLAFDYRIAKSAIQRLCDALDEVTLLPGESPHARIRERDGYVEFEFAGEVMKFLPRDVKVLPVANITVEELSRYLATRLAATLRDEAKVEVPDLSVRVASSSGQAATYSVNSST